MEVDEPGGRTYEVGRVLAWDPPGRLSFEFRARAFASDESTTVDVRFEAVAGGTRVRLEHRGWASLPEDHPARAIASDQYLTNWNRCLPLPAVRLSNETYQMRFVCAPCVYWDEI